MTTATFMPTIKAAKIRTMEVKKCRQILKNLGTRAAAGYLRNRGWSVEAALFIICGK